MGKMNVNLGTIEAYRAKEAEFQGRLRELEAVTAQRDEVELTDVGFLSTHKLSRRSSRRMRHCASVVWMSLWRAST